MFDRVGAEWTLVFFLVATISVLYFIYVTFHCIPMLQLGVPLHIRDAGMRMRGFGQVGRIAAPQMEAT